MIPRSATRFHFALTHPECQRALKSEVESRYPEVRFAFSRPGFVTFKQVAPLGRPFEPRLALVSGESVGAATNAEELRARFDAMCAESAFAEAVRAGTLRPRVWRIPKPEGAPLDPAAPDTAVSDGLDADELGLPEFVHEVIAPVEGSERFLDVIWLDGSASDAGSPASSTWFGVSRDPVGVRRVRAAVPLPLAAPSRAYSKFEEVLLATALPFERGQRVLELGAAPGGTTFALLSRGLAVVAVDPGEMAESLGSLQGGEFQHVRKPAGQLSASDLGGAKRMDWLVSDMNLAPPVAATQIAHAWSLVKKTARGAILTIKMNDDRAVRALPDVERRLVSLFGGTLRVLHLPSHRREVALVIECR